MTTAPPAMSTVGTMARTNGTSPSRPVDVQHEVVGAAGVQDVAHRAELSPATVRAASPIRSVS